ncbi:MAG: hypothetical protein ACR2PW_07080 [Gammaproteobacteria bacterium]
MEKIIEEWVKRSILKNVDDLPEVGANISVFPGVKIAFDGYAEDDDGIEDVNEQSYAVYIHKNSAEEGFVFPEHEKTAWAIVSRPSEEICHFVWLSVDAGGFSGPSLQDSIANSSLEPAQIESVIEALASKHQS